MFFNLWQFALLFSLLDLASARAFFVPEDLQHDAAFWASDDFIPIRRRAEDTCGAGLDTCGASFPSDFCCSTGTTCLSLNTSSSITAALCCPAGQDCQTINPVNCNQDLQDASSNPGSQLHSSPTTELETCGKACCPMGYTCNGANVCVAQTAAEAAASKPSTTSTATSSSSTSSASATEAASTKEVPTEGSSSSDSFSGKAFAAGFVPGIALGALLTACILFVCVRRQRRRDSTYISHEKQQRSPGRDTLTDLGPFATRRPTVHGRSISEPTADITMGHRTEFLNSSPPYHNDSSSPNCRLETPKDNPPPRKHWLSHSPFVNHASSPIATQSPIPSHMKRGTLSFQISPVRALKKQRSMHSLRRHMTTNATSSRSSSSRSRNGMTSRTDSTETIKVLMATPQQNSSSLVTNSNSTRPTLPPLPTVASWQTAIESTNNTPIDAEQPPIQFPTSNNHYPETQTPTRPGRNSAVPHIGATLSSPYTPSNYPPASTTNNPLAVRGDDSRMKLDSLWPPPASKNRESAWRQTTFTGMMEKAGLRKSQLLMGPDPREWNR